MDTIQTPPTSKFQLNTKTKVILISVSLATAFAFGRYTVPEKVRVETKIVESEKKSEDKTIENKKDRHRKTTITEVTKPNGEKVKTTVITDDTNQDNKTVDTSKTVETEDTSTSKETVRGDSKVTISALTGINLQNGSYKFGASLTKPVLGPITLGAWGFNDASFGLSVGLTF